jgi:hypothetical protein
MLRLVDFLALLICLAWLPNAQAHHLTFALQVRAGAAEKTAGPETAALGQKPQSRGVVDARTGERLSIRWTLASNDARTTYKDVIVHLFVVRVEKTGLATVPKLDRGVVCESALSMDFKPNDKAAGELTLAIDQPGTYLLRVETIGAAVGVDGHEHFAALDLVVH